MFGSYEIHHSVPLECSSCANAFFLSPNILICLALPVFIDLFNAFSQIWVSNDLKVLQVAYGAIQNTSLFVL